MKRVPIRSALHSNRVSISLETTMITVVELPMPSMNTGAPLPVLIADDYSLALAYLVWTDERCETDKPFGVRFLQAHQHVFGSPNDEALFSHPLYQHGLEAYAVSEVLESPWTAELEERSQLAAREILGDHFKPDEFKSSMRHLVWTFHDSTLEVFCDGFEELTDEEAARIWSLSYRTDNS